MRMRPLAQASGAPPDLAGANLRIAQAAGCKGGHGTAIRLNEQNLVILRAIGNRRQEAVTPRFLGASCLERGDADVAAQWYAQAQAVHQMVDEPIEACENAAELTSPADRDRLIQALPVFRAVVAARQRRDQAAPGAMPSA